MADKLTSFVFAFPVFFDSIKGYILNGNINIDVSLLLIAVATSFGGSLLQIFEKKREGKLQKNDIPYIFSAGAFITFIIYQIGVNTKISNYIGIASALGGYMSLDLLYGIKKTGSMLRVFIPNAVKAIIKNWINYEEKPKDDE